VLSAFSVMLMDIAVNTTAAALLAFTIFFYVVVYTIWLKRSTPQNIVIGGASGAFPPMIGWAAVTGDVSLASIALFLIIFMWTPPHFWALSLFVRSDYAAAGVPMMPVVAGTRATRRQVFLYSLPMAVAAILPWPLGLTHALYGLASVLLSGWFVWLAWRVAASRVAEQAAMTAERALFKYSVVYLFVLFGILVADRVLLP